MNTLKSQWCDACDDLTKHLDGQCWEGKHGPIYKTCLRCKERKRLDSFSLRYDAGRLRRPNCKECVQRVTREHSHTLRGFIEQMYVRLRRRCLGKTKDYKIYRGLPFMSKAEFLAIAQHDVGLKTIFKQYMESGRIFKLAPSTHRIIPRLGYVPWNISFVTVSENSKDPLIWETRRKNK